MSGTNFEESDELKASFNGHVVPAFLSNAGEIILHAPPGQEPGYVDLRISLKDGLWSSPVKYLYYETPEIHSIEPTCGPDFGYTQIAVTGKNFIDLGHNMALCVFNGTIFTNATIFSETLVYCDSPAF